MGSQSAINFGSGKFGDYVRILGTVHIGDVGAVPYRVVLFYISESVLRKVVEDR